MSYRNGMKKSKFEFSLQRIHDQTRIIEQQITLQIEKKISSDYELCHKKIQASPKVGQTNVTIKSKKNPFHSASIIPHHL